MKSLLAASAVLVVVLAGVAGAQGTSVAVRASVPKANGTLVTKQATVEYGDLNLAGKDGAKTLLSRLGKAAAAVCSSQGGQRSLADVSRAGICQARAVREAVVAVGSPELSAAASE
jgi:UrcA family protein